MMFPGQEVKEKGSGTQFPVDFSTTSVTPDPVKEREREREKAQETFII